MKLNSGAEQPHYSMFNVGCSTFIYYTNRIYAVAIWRKYCINIYNNDLIDNKPLNGQEELKWNQGTYLRDWWM